MYILLFILMTIILMATDCGSARSFTVDLSHITSGSQKEHFNGTGLGIGDSTTPRALMPLAINLLKDFEGWRPNAYNDSSAYCTIGYGHLIALKSCEVSTAELAAFSPPLKISDGERILDGDTRIARNAISRLVREPLTDEQFGALTSFVFNIGTSNFKNSKMLRYINEGEYVGAVRQFARWVQSKGTVIEGLIIRRTCEAALFRGELRSDGIQSFDRKECASLGVAPVTESLINVEDGED